MNEDQATYLVTLFRNTPTVRKFKLNLVKAFRAALNSLAALPKAKARKTIPPPATLKDLEAAYNAELLDVHAKILAVDARSSPASPRSVFIEELLLHAHTRRELMQYKVRAAQLEYELATTKLDLKLRSLPCH